MRVLILGGTAFMGPHLVRCLTAAGHSVALFHRGQTRTDLTEGVTSIYGDRNHLGNHIPELRAFKPDVVVDMIAFNTHDAQDLVEVFSGFAGRAVVASSADVYRNFGALIGVETHTPDATALTETALLRTKRYPFRAQAHHRTDAMYAYDKIDVEETLRASALPTTLLRLPLVFGPGDRQRRLSPYLKRLKDGAEVLHLGQTHARQITCRGYSPNMAHAIALAVTNPASTNQTYNLADKPQLTEQAFLEALIPAAGFTARVEVLPDQDVPLKERHPGDPTFHLHLDTTKLARDLGYAPSVPLAEALKTTAEWELSTL